MEKYNKRKKEGDFPPILDYRHCRLVNVNTLMNRFYGRWRETVSDFSLRKAQIPFMRTPTS